MFSLPLFVSRGVSKRGVFCPFPSNDYKLQTENLFDSDLLGYHYLISYPQWIVQGLILLRWIDRKLVTVENWASWHPTELQEFLYASVQRPWTGTSLARDVWFETVSMCDVVDEFRERNAGSTRRKESFASDFIFGKFSSLFIFSSECLMINFANG